MSNDNDFWSKHNIDHGRIVSRYIQVLRMIESFITMKKITQCVIIDTKMLKTAICDYFTDVARIKEFHPITLINDQKIYGYEAYWILRRKPIQVKVDFPGSEYINELFVTGFLMALMFNIRRVGTEKRNQNKTLGNFQESCRSGKFLRYIFAY